MPSLENARNKIFSVIDISTGEVKDLPAIREIRKKIASLHKEIGYALKKYTSDSTLNSALQNNVPALKARLFRELHEKAWLFIVHSLIRSAQSNHPQRIR